jgi:hypothetical protein
MLKKILPFKDVIAFILVLVGATYGITKFIVIDPLKAQVDELKGEQLGQPKIRTVTPVDGVANGEKYITQTVAYSDSEGDATMVAFIILNTDGSDLRTTNVLIGATDEAQKNGAFETGTWRCGLKSYSLTMAAIVSDSAGHFSKPYVYAMTC